MRPRARCLDGLAAGASILTELPRRPAEKAKCLPFADAFPDLIAVRCSDKQV